MTGTPLQRVTIFGDPNAPGYGHIVVRSAFPRTADDPGMQSGPILIDGYDVGPLPPADIRAPILIDGSEGPDGLGQVRLYLTETNPLPAALRYVQVEELWLHTEGDLTFANVLARARSVTVELGIRDDSWPGLPLATVHPLVGSTAGIPGLAGADRRYVPVERTAEFFGPMYIPVTQPEPWLEADERSLLEHAGA